MLSNDRRKSRLGLKVIHRHRIGDKVFRRVSELEALGPQRSGDVPSAEDF